MSYTSEKQRANPVTMGAAIAINGSIILAIALSTTVVQDVLTTTRPPWEKYIDIKPKPKPDPQPPKNSTSAPKDNPVDQIDPTIKTIPTTDASTTDTGPIGPSATDGMGGGDDAVDIVRPVDPPKPIFKAAMRDPRYAGNFQPTYPPGLIQKEIEGSAKVKVLIGTDGRVRQVIILSATHPDFGKATERQALSKWRFKPATRDGVAVEDWQTLTVTFHLDT